VREQLDAELRKKLGLNLNAGGHHEFHYRFDTSAKCLNSGFTRATQPRKPVYRLSGHTALKNLRKTAFFQHSSLYNGAVIFV